MEDPSSSLISLVFSNTFRTVFMKELKGWRNLLIIVASFIYFDRFNRNKSFDLVGNDL